jgi:hypothetical protein
MANDIGRMPLPAKVNLFQVEIGGEQQFMSGRRPQDGAVIADPAHQAGIFAPVAFRYAANPRNQLSFW